MPVPPRLGIVTFDEVIVPPTNKLFVTDKLFVVIVPPTDKLFVTDKLFAVIVRRY